MNQKGDWETLDLVQHQIISAVATQQQQRPKVCFKGGTLLRACSYSTGCWTGCLRPAPPSFALLPLPLLLPPTDPAR